MIQRITNTPPVVTSRTDGDDTAETVQYLGRHLYSTYHPRRAVCETVAALPLREYTLVLGCSPVLGYGLPELLARLPPHCFVLLVEADHDLHDLCRERVPAAVLSDPRVTLLPPQCDAASFIAMFNRLFSGMLPRRCIRLDLSAGTQFAPKMYELLHQSADAVIAQFWKNRITLTRLGRLFARNLLRNLARLPLSRPLASWQLDRPVLVVGAGPSADAVLDDYAAGRRGNAFVLAVDTALPALLERHIVPDAVVQLEAQQAIDRAYYGAAGMGIPLWLDLVSRPSCAEATGGQVSYFFSAYTDAPFIDDLHLRGILPPEVPPLGSVGLTAVYLALLLRTSAAVPIAVCGLDFAFTAGCTHCRRTPADTESRLHSTRLAPVGSPAAAFAPGVNAVTGKDGGIVYSYAALSGYAAAFRTVFADVENLYDIGVGGLPLAITQVPDYAFPAVVPPPPARTEETFHPGHTAEALTAYYAHETATLESLRAALDASFSAGTVPIAPEAIPAYLYLHFPDGYQPTGDVGFLKRVRAEIDFFLKDLRLALSWLKPY